MRILPLNGPTLGGLGGRQPESYGRRTLDEIVDACVAHAAGRGATLDCLQSNHEGALIDRLERPDFDAVVINHTEPDHSGALGELLRQNPAITVYCTRPGENFLKQLFDQPMKTHVVADGEELDLGGKTLRFFLAPNLHWPDTMFTYLAQDEILTGEAAVTLAGAVAGPFLAEAAGLAVSGGVLADSQRATSDRFIYAAGDVANFHSPALGRRIRVEHEDNALTMGRRAGANMAGHAEPYHHLPFFYSDLFDLGYEAVGDLDARHEIVADWKDPFREGVVYYLAGGRVRGVLLWNTWGQVDAARALIAESGPFQPKDLKSRLPACTPHAAAPGAALVTTSG